MMTRVHPSINHPLDNVQGQGKSLRKKGKLAYVMQNDNDGETINQANKTIIFMIGGIGYNEVRSLLSNPSIS